MLKRLILLLLFPASLCHACTTFFLNNDGQLIFGRNYDWLTGNGMICSNQRGLAKTSVKMSDGNSISWVSLYGSISFNQYGKEFPTGGMNEKGLVVELMWLDGTKYPAADQRPSVGVLQWIQYQLDNCASVSELIESDKKLRIASKETAPLHYLVADASGNAATIEFFDGKMVVHRGAELPFPVLANDSYSSSIEYFNNSRQAAGVNGTQATESNSSLNRFATACSMVQQFQSGKSSAVSPIDYSFSILSNVAQGTHTKWSIVYDLKNKTVYFKTLGYPDIKRALFSDFNFDCKSSSKVWDLNQNGSGNIIKAAADYTEGFNKKMVDRSFEESKQEISSTVAEREEMYFYPRQISCAPKP